MRPPGALVTPQRKIMRTLAQQATSFSQVPGRDVVPRGVVVQPTQEIPLGGLFDIRVIAHHIVRRHRIMRRDVCRDVLIKLPEEIAHAQAMIVASVLKNSVAQREERILRIDVGRDLKRLADVFEDHKVMLHTAHDQLIGHGIDKEQALEKQVIAAILRVLVSNEQQITVPGSVRADVEGCKS